MDRIFSVGDISDQFWSPPPPPPPIAPAPGDLKMSRSASEWAFQRFLQEAAAATSSSDVNSPSRSAGEDDVVEIKDIRHLKDVQSCCHNNQGVIRRNGGDAHRPDGIPSTVAPAAETTPLSAGSGVVAESDAYQEFLKSRLNLACAAVALTRAPFVVGQSSSGAAESTSQVSAGSQLVTEVPSKESKEKDAGEPIGIPCLPVKPKKFVAQIKPAMSGSSRDLSDDDDEGEGENGTEGGPTDTKRARRMLSNRESARRSRRRKQAHLGELETQVSQLRVENASLLERLTDVSQKFNEASVDNRVLKADIETLRAKVKMAEETVKRVTGMNPLLQAMSEMTTMGMPAFAGSPSDSADAAVPVLNPKPHFF